MKHYDRLIEKYMGELLTDLSAISLDGLKGVGKTSSAKAFAQTVFELDRRQDHLLISNNIDKLRDSVPPVLIDEWQKIPETWEYVRRDVDARHEAGRYILTGSISSKDSDMHSGAGRIVRTRMYPLSLQERSLDSPTVLLKDILAEQDSCSLTIAGETEIDFENYMDEILLSGLPALRIDDEKNRRRMITSYLNNLLTHEFRQEGITIRQPNTLRRWLTGYAASISTTAGYNEILDVATSGEGSKPAAKTTIAYREALEKLWLIDELPPWLNGEDYYSRLKKSAKHYIADTAFVASLLGLSKGKLVGGDQDRNIETKFDKKYGNIIGRLFEALVFQSLRVYAMVNDAELSYFHTQNGDREIDFMLTQGATNVAIEVKTAPYVDDKDVRHLKWLKEQMAGKLKDAIIITTGQLAYRRPDGIAVVPAVLLGA
jgi:predicted AAA+ superfamily ATPase